jgi:hypothetical protein
MHREGGVMTNSSKIKNASDAQLPVAKKLAPPAKPFNCDDVAWVLEHVSSPFRWELLEVPPVLPISSEPKN